MFASLHIAKTACKLGQLHGRLLDMADNICTFVLCMKSKARAEKRSEVETGLDELSRRCAALSADAGLARVWPISDNGLARSSMFESWWIQRLDLGCQEAVSSRAKHPADAADLLSSRSMPRDCCD